MIDIVYIVRILVLLLLIVLAVILVTRRLAVPYTLGLVVVGLLISLFGFLPGIHLTPELVLFVFLPALLFFSQPIRLCCLRSWYKASVYGSS